MAKDMERAGDKRDESAVVDAFCKGCMAGTAS
jgi:hypothetical protein